MKATRERVQARVVPEGDYNVVTYMIEPHSDQHQMKRDSGRLNNVPDSRGSGSPVKPCSRASAIHSRKLENVRVEALLEPSSPTQRHAHSHATALTVRTGLVMNSHVMNRP